MQTFFAMLLTLRVGLVPGPTDSVVRSIREQALQAANVVVDRDRFVGREQVPVRTLSLTRSRTAAARTAGGWGPPPVVRDVAKEDWRDLFARALNGNQTIANAVTWIAAAPVRLNVGPERVFVAITVRTP